MCEYKTFTILFENPRFLQFSRRVPHYSLCPSVHERLGRPAADRVFVPAFSAQLPARTQENTWALRLYKTPRAASVHFPRQRAQRGIERAFPRGGSEKKFPTIHEHSERGVYNLNVGREYQTHAEKKRRKHT